MSPVKTIKTFRDLLAFLTVIPVGGKEDFVFTSAENMYLFPLIGSFIGLIAGAYYISSNFILQFLLNGLNNFITLPVTFLARFTSAAMTIAFLLVITGLQHFDGLIDLGNALGYRNEHDRKMAAHAWTVNYSGAIFAIIIEFIAFFSLFMLTPAFNNPLIILTVLITAEVAAKLAMVTLVWIGKPTYKGLGSIFLKKAKKKLNIIAYVISSIIVFTLFTLTHNPVYGLLGVGVVFANIPIVYIMEKAAEKIFGGVTGDVIGATNEISRAITFVLLIGVLIII
ncbi:MAG: adenosylcobinamide-GDP ribazoletransferase [Candidatus Bathyarchaeota archaeon]|nr:adenosylcobinamide-GDP ribazoletransferase [Candidatus Termiticorpusculum sp.]MCL2868678.1 adenosylcobinamide-GDP ribazoletransferase [Candidatus Termiticorpusculum sp.]